MCKAARFVAMALALVCASASGLVAQGTSTRIRAQERLVDSLVAKHEAALAALKTYEDSVTRAAMRFDTVKVGNLRLYIDPGIREHAERAAKIAATRIDSLAGTASGRAASEWIVIRAQRNDTLRDTVVVAIRARLHERSSFVREVQPVWGVPSDSALAEWVYQASVAVLAMSIRYPMNLWLYGQGLPDSLPTSAWLSARLDIVSSPMSVAHRCYEGDLAACKMSLRLVPVGDVVTEWFDAASRRRFVETWRSRMQRVSPEMDRCAEGSDAACLTLMRQADHYQDPIPPHHRNGVIKTAMRMAGDRGYERFLTATGTPAEQLAAIAGVPLDSVLKVWLRTVHEARRPSKDMSPGIAFSSLGWILVCGVLALRSTRWR